MTVDVTGNPDSCDDADLAALDAREGWVVEDYCYYGPAY